MVLDQRFMRVNRGTKNSWAHSLWQAICFIFSHNISARHILLALVYEWENPAKYFPGHRSKAGQPMNRGKSREFSSAGGLPVQMTVSGPVFLEGPLGSVLQLWRCLPVPKCRRGLVVRSAWPGSECQSGICERWLLQQIAYTVKTGVSTCSVDTLFHLARGWRKWVQILYFSIWHRGNEQ